MQAKDAPRLAVLRSLLSQTLNASKTTSPIITDMQMLALLRKTANASRAASAEFLTAGRQDLADKENGQVGILEEYAEGVEMMGAEEITRVVGEMLDAIKKEGGNLQIGDVLKRVFGPEVLGDKQVDRADVARIVKKLMS